MKAVSFGANAVAMLLRDQPSVRIVNKSKMNFTRHAAKPRRANEEHSPSAHYVSLIYQKRAVDIRMLV